MIKVATIQEAVDLIHANAVPKGETVYVVAPQSEERPLSPRPAVVGEHRRMGTRTVARRPK